MLVMLIYSLFLGAPSYGKFFQTDFLEIEIPENWACKKNEKVWRCDALDSGSKGPAFYSFGVEPVKKKRTLEEIQKFYSVKISNGETDRAQSKALYSKLVPLNGKWWVDALHHGLGNDELYTRYLITYEGEQIVTVKFQYPAAQKDVIGPIIEAAVKGIKVFYIQPECRILPPLPKCNPEPSGLFL